MNQKLTVKDAILVSLSLAGQGTLIFTTHPASHEVTVGESVTITCNVSDPNAEIYWQYEYVAIDSSNTDYIINGGSLTINNFIVSKSGCYRCAASDDKSVTVLLSHIGLLTAFSKLSFNTLSQKVERFK